MEGLAVRMGVQQADVDWLPAARRILGNLHGVQHRVEHVHRNHH